MHRRKCPNQASLKPPYTEISRLLEISRVEINLRYAVVAHVPFETCTCVKKTGRRTGVSKYIYIMYVWLGVWFVWGG